MRLWLRSATAPGILVGLFVVSAALALVILPAPHTAFHYMLAGAFATAITMLGLLVLFSERRTRLKRGIRVQEPSGDARADAA